MPSKPHPCAHDGCDALVSPRATYCKRHRIITPEHRSKLSSSLKGRVFSDDHRQRLSQSSIDRSPNPPVEASCARCGKAFKVRASLKQRFCSRACGFAHKSGERSPMWNPDIPMVSCEICGKQFRKPATTVERYTCSRTCRNIRMLKRQKTNSTNIERIMEAALIRHGIAFESQVPLCAVTIADFYIPATKTAIFCDGDYWHSRPEHVARDGRQTATLEAAGYTVHRFLGSAIMSDVDSCLTAVFPVNRSQRATIRSQKPGSSSVA